MIMIRKTDISCPYLQAPFSKNIPAMTATVRDMLPRMKITETTTAKHTPIINLIMCVDDITTQMRPLEGTFLEI